MLEFYLSEAIKLHQINYFYKKPIYYQNVNFYEPR